MKFNNNGKWQDVSLKVLDTLPIGTEVEYDGTEVPEGWEKIDDEVILFQSTDGSNDQTITLSDDISKYKTAEVYYSSTVSTYGVHCMKIDLSIANRICLQMILQGSYWGTLINSLWDFSGNTIQRKNEYWFGGNNGKIVEWWSSGHNETRIYKIVGYK